MNLCIKTLKVSQCVFLGDGVLRAGDALKIRVSEADLKYPQRIYATNYRKYMASITQVRCLYNYKPTKRASERCLRGKFTP